MNFATPYDNYDLEARFEPLNDEPSMTVPDQSLTVRDILKRYANGQPLDVHSFDDDGFDIEPEFDDAPPPVIDLTDVDENRRNIDELQNQLNNEKDDTKPVASTSRQSEGSSSDVGSSSAASVDSSVTSV